MTTIAATLGVHVVDDIAYGSVIAATLLVATSETMNPINESIVLENGDALLTEGGRLIVVEGEE